VQVGDLVKIETKAWVMQRDYPSYGIIMEVQNPKHGQTRMHVLWSDGSITYEWSCYLEVISESR